MKVVLLANGKVGLDVCRFLSQAHEDLYALVVPDEGGSFDSEIKKSSGLKASDIFHGNINTNKSFVKRISSRNDIILITVYWPWLLPEDIFGLAHKTINFHPAPLPINRGWYPHVHSIIDGSLAGVTLHVIEKDADTGPIWAQKIIDIRADETAFDLYQRLQVEIFSLFKENWCLIKRGEIIPRAQNHQDGNYHSKKEVHELDLIDLDQEYKARDLINLLRARSFGKRGFAYFYDGDDKVFLRLNLSRRSEA